MEAYADPEDAPQRPLRARAAFAVVMPPPLQVCSHTPANGQLHPVSGSPRFTPLISQTHPLEFGRCGWSGVRWGRIRSEVPEGHVDHHSRLGRGEERHRIL